MVYSSGVLKTRFLKAAAAVGPTVLLTRPLPVLAQTESLEDRADVVTSLEDLSSLMGRLDDEGYGWPNVAESEGEPPKLSSSPG